MRGGLRPPVGRAEPRVDLRDPLSSYEFELEIARIASGATSSAPAGRLA